MNAYFNSKVRLLNMNSNKRVHVQLSCHGLGMVLPKLVLPSLRLQKHMKFMLLLALLLPLEVAGEENWRHQRQRSQAEIRATYRKQQWDKKTNSKSKNITNKRCKTKKWFTQESHDKIWLSHHTPLSPTWQRDSLLRNERVHFSCPGNNVRWYQIGIRCLALPMHLPGSSPSGLLWKINPVVQNQNIIHSLCHLHHTQILYLPIIYIYTQAQVSFS